MPETYDFVVIGAGVFGAWTAYYLRLSGFAVALLDAYGPASSRASSGGETRVIRMGYGPDELYTRWSARSLAIWKEFAKATNQEIFHKTGVLWLSDGSDLYTQQVPAALSHAGIACNTLSATEIQRNYPQLSFKNVIWGVLEPESGVLMARQAVQAVVNECMRVGVDYFLAAALAPSGTTNLQAIRTSAGDFLSAGAFIFACGPWLPRLFPDLLADRIRSTRQEVFFLGVPPGNDAFSAQRMPVWLHPSHPNRPYALPDIANRGVKFAFDRHGSDFDPDTGSRVVGESAIAELRGYLQEHIPSLQNAPIVETRVCQYENTSNGDFFIDRHPEFDNVWFAGGGSGHGFKHGPAVGEHVRDLVMQKVPVEPRFSLATKQTDGIRSVF
jgi:sarcosine oxidase